MNLKPQLQSFVMAGFECSYSLDQNKERWDLLRDSRHDIYCREDYQRLKTLGITSVREGLAWYQIDKGNGVYDYSRFEPMMQIAQEEGVQQVWDFNHYDYPEDIDPFSQDFIDRFAAYAVKTIELIRKYQQGIVYVTLINEISYIAWICGDIGKWAPYTKGPENGIKLKSQLIRATIAAMKAIRTVDSDVRFLQVDPYMYREATEPARAPALKAASEFNEVARFQTWDMLSGKAFPELGGAPEFLDIIGINYYIDNQQWLHSSPDTKRVSFERVPIDAPSRRTLYAMLSEVYERYERPIVITETGSYGDNRQAWWQRLVPEVLECLDKKLPLHGVCIYPTVDNPDHGHFLVPHSGIFDFKPRDTTYERHPHEPSLQEISKLIAQTKK